MSEDRISASGFTEDDDVILARQITAMDLAQSLSLDTELGGVITPAVQIQIDGEGIGGRLETSLLSGDGSDVALTRSESGRMKRLLDITTILDQAGANIIEPNADKFEVPNGHTQVLIVDLDKGGTVVPGLGDTIEVYRRGSPGFNVDIRDDDGGSIIATFSGATTNQNGGVWFAKFVYDGTNWQLYQCSMDTSP